MRQLLVLQLTQVFLSLLEKEKDLRQSSRCQDLPQPRPLHSGLSDRKKAFDLFFFSKKRNFIFLVQGHIDIR